MNFYGSVVLEHEKNDRKYWLSLPLGVSYEDAHAAVLEIANGVLEMQKQTEAAQKAAAAENQQSQSAPLEAEIVSTEATD